MQRTSVRDDAHELEAEAVQILSLSVQIGQLIVFEQAVTFKEAVQLGVGAKTEQPSQFGMVQPTSLILGRRERLQRPDASDRQRCPIERQGHRE